MAWSEKEAVEAGEVVCVMNLGMDTFFKGQTYKVKDMAGEQKLYHSQGNVYRLGMICENYNRHFKAIPVKLEND